MAKNKSSRQILVNIIQSEGPKLSKNPQRVKAFLRDLCTDQDAEIHVLVAAAKQGVPEELLKNTSGNSIELLIPKLKKRLIEKVAMKADAANWAVESWAFALGINFGEIDEAFEYEGLTYRNPSTGVYAEQALKVPTKDEPGVNGSDVYEIDQATTKNVPNSDQYVKNLEKTTSGNSSDNQSTAKIGTGSSSSTIVQPADRGQTNLKGTYFNCPACSQDFYAEKNGKVRCDKCGKKYTVNQIEKRLAGIYIKCPFCPNSYYTEKNGKVKCQKCRRVVTVNQKERKLTGLRIDCPYCTKNFYTEKNGKTWCEGCGKKLLVIQKERRLGGLHINCPYCAKGFYTEKNGKIKCENCSKKFTVNQKARSLVGKIVECPYCTHNFFSEKNGKIKCEKCRKKFTILA